MVTDTTLRGEAADTPHQDAPHDLQLPGSPSASAESQGTSWADTYMPEPEEEQSALAWHLPPPGIHVTGTQLRKRLITPEVLAAIEPEPEPTFFQRLARRLFGRG